MGAVYTRIIANENKKKYIENIFIVNFKTFLFKRV